jgi:hypothetical protein
VQQARRARERAEKQCQCEMDIDGALKLLNLIQLIP